VLTPEEIQSREFLVSLRGYDRDEVHAFLDEVAEAFAQLLAEESPMPDSSAVHAPEPAPVAPAAAPPPAEALSSFAAIGAETQRILEAAQEAGDQIPARAQSEATRAREEAIAGAQAQVAALKERAAETQRQIDVLELRRAEVADRLRQARETADLGLSELIEDVAAQDEMVEHDLAADDAVERDVTGPEQLSTVITDAAEVAGTSEEPVAGDAVVGGEGVAEPDAEVPGGPAAAR
jgi:cell division initiation protein